MSPSNNPMRDQVLATPPSLHAAFDEMERAVRLVLSTPQIYAARRILLTGSGDSFFAARAAEFAIARSAGIPVEARTPMEAGRYAAQLTTPEEARRTLVVALSNSGGAARVAEAAGLFRERGALVLAMTKAPEGRLAGLADKALILPVPNLPSAPGFGPYAFAMVALFLLGIRIGEVRMHVTMDQAQAERGRLKQLIGSLAPRFAEADARSAELAATVADRPIVEFLGAGPDYAVAEYGAAKLLEAAGHHAYARDLEEWAHLNYFDARPEDISTVIAIAPESRAQGRAVELLAYLHRLGRRIFVVGGGPAADAARRLGHAVLPVDGPEELWSPLLLSAPMALIAAQMATAGGAEYGRGSQGRWADSADASTVQKSEIWKPAP